MFHRPSIIAPLSEMLRSVAFRRLPLWTTATLRSRFWRGARAQAPLRWRDAGLTFASAAVAMALGMTLILQAMKDGQAGLVAILSSVTPIVVLPLLWLVYRRRPAVGAWSGAVLAVAGTALILR